VPGHEASANNFIRHLRDSLEAAVLMERAGWYKEDVFERSAAAAEAAAAGEQARRRLPPPAPSPSPTALLPDAPPDPFDLGDVNGTNFLLPVRNHHLPLGSACASCWAATAATVVGTRLGVLEGSGERFEVSAQYLLNCVPGQKYRCGYPGTSVEAMKFISEAGIPDESCAPWQNIKLPCDPIHICASMTNPPTHRGKNASTVLVAVDKPRMHRVQSIVHVPPNDTVGIQRGLLSGPVACGIHAESFKKYLGGVLRLPEPNPTVSTHAIAIVGYGHDQGVDYWRIQNNWGASWGEQGFVRVQRGVNWGGVEQKCLYPLMVHPRQMR
jgi:hypothetical protein